MKTLLVALNASYSHTALGLRSLAAYAQNPDVEILEYTINQPLSAVLQDIALRRPAAVGFSCFLWSVRPIADLSAALRALYPDLPIFWGGPEVSFDAPAYLAQNPAVDFILRGEGEVPFRLFLEGADPETLPGVTTRTAANPPAAPLPLDAVPFAYSDVPAHKMLYYETQRGCPYDCQYCLSAGHAVRFLSRERVERDLQWFLDQKVRLVKLVDRTFNCNRAHARHIWEYLLAHDNGLTGFHMELAGDLLEAEDLRLLASARPGLFQLEIGVQSTHAPTLSAIHRQNVFDRLSANVRAIHAVGNVHQHLDLIAGLPYEDYAAFRQSFDDVYALAPDQLQLGFLKLLRGSGLRRDAEKLGIRYDPAPPYRVLCTPDLDYAALCQLEAIAQMVELFYNSGKARRTLAAAIPYFTGPFAFYEALGDYWKATGRLSQYLAKPALYEGLYAFLAAHVDPSRLPPLAEALAVDMLEQDRLPELPAWLPLPPDRPDARRAFFADDALVVKYLPDLLDLPPVRRARACRLLWTADAVWLFDYTHPKQPRIHRLEEPLCVQTKPPVSGGSWTS